MNTKDDIFSVNNHLPLHAREENWPLEIKSLVDKIKPKIASSKESELTSIFQSIPVEEKRTLANYFIKKNFIAHALGIKKSCSSFNKHFNIKQLTRNISPESHPLLFQLITTTESLSRDKKYDKVVEDYHKLKELIFECSYLSIIAQKLKLAQSTLENKVIARYGKDSLEKLKTESLNNLFSKIEKAPEDQIDSIIQEVNKLMAHLPPHRRAKAICQLPPHIFKYLSNNKNPEEFASSLGIAPYSINREKQALSETLSNPKKKIKTEQQIIQNTLINPNYTNDYSSLENRQSLNSAINTPALQEFGLFKLNDKSISSKSFQSVDSKNFPDFNSPFLFNQFK